MTIRVTIKNEDARDTAIIEVRVCTRGVPHGFVTGINPTDEVTELRGGQRVEKLVHSAQDLLVREITT